MIDEEDYQNFLADTEGEDGDEIRSIIMEQACDTAEQLCEMECKLHNIDCLIIDKEGDVEVSRYTEEAQEIFDGYYDEQTDELFRVLYRQMKILFDE